MLHPSFCFLHTFNLLHRAQCDEILLAWIDLAVEPSDIVDFADMLIGEESSKKKIQGMLQVNAFTPATDPRRFLAERGAKWRSERAKADSERFHTDAVAILDVVQADGKLKACMFISFRIRSEVREWGYPRVW